MENGQNSDSFFKRLILTFVFFTVTPITLFASVLALSAVSSSNSDLNKPVTANLIDSPKPGLQVYASLPDNFPSLHAEVTSADARPEIIKNYLQENESPLFPYAGFIVQTADKYGLDYRLITAIAQKESGLCRVIPEDSHNCWGWGIHSKGTLMFDSYEEGIEIVSKGLKENYIDLGYITLDEIMSKYAHPSSTTWAEGVYIYMNQMK